MIELLFAGLWAEVWKYGLVGAILAGCFAAWWFIPFNWAKQLAIAVASITVASCVGYTIGVKDEAARHKKQAAIVEKKVDSAVNRARHPARRMPDRWDTPN